MLFTRRMTALSLLFSTFFVPFTCLASPLIDESNEGRVMHLDGSSYACFQSTSAGIFGIITGKESGKRLFQKKRRSSETRKLKAKISKLIHKKRKKALKARLNTLRLLPKFSSACKKFIQYKPCPAVLSAYGVCHFDGSRTPVEAAGEFVREFGLEGKSWQLGTMGTSESNTIDAATLSGGSFVILSSGRLEFGGKPWDAAYLRAYRRNGEIDPRFGEGGQMQVDLSAIGLSLLPRGLKIIGDRLYVFGKISEVSSKSRSVIVAYSLRGQRASNFATDGVLAFEELADTDIDSIEGLDAAVDFKSGLSGPLVALRRTQDKKGREHYYLQSFDTQGLPSKQFGEAGMLSLELSIDATTVFRQLRVFNDGSILLSGNTDIADPGTYRYQGFLLKLLASGQVDQRFGTHGLTLLNFDELLGKPYRTGISTATSESGDLYAISNLTLRQSDGFSSEERLIAIAKLGPNGRLDSAFGAQGKTLLRIGGSAVARQAVVQPDGKLLVGGSAFPCPPTSTQSQCNVQSMFVARINMRGEIDEKFGVIDTRASMGDLIPAALRDNKGNGFGTSAIAISQNREALVVGGLSSSAENEALRAMFKVRID